MRAPNARRYLSALRDAEEALTGAERSRDEDRIWRALLDCLAWLYRSEEHERIASPTYYAQRGAVPTGRVLAALIYFRGQVEHAKQGDPYRLGALRTQRYTNVQGSAVSARALIKTAGGWSESQSRIARYVYPPLHEGAPADRYGRDLLYRQLIEGQPLVPLVSDARGFLESC